MDGYKKNVIRIVQLAKIEIWAVLFFVINRSDADIFEPAWDIDKKYSEALVDAFEEGLEVLAYQVEIEPPYAVIEEAIVTNISR